MTAPEDRPTTAAQAEQLCQACGLCCSGHLFIWVKLKPSELDPLEQLGVEVFRDDPTQRGFSQPCPLWHGTCSIYHSPHYPRACKAYRCKLLKALQAGEVVLADALAVVDQAKAMIAGITPLLPGSDEDGFRQRLTRHQARLQALQSTRSFRERLVALIEHPEENQPSVGTPDEFRQKADALLAFYAEQFGVNDLLE